MRPERRFQFRLALALSRTVRELGDSLGSDELTEWQAFDSLEPIGETRTENMLAILCSIFANAHRGKGSRRFRMVDFIPDYEKLALPQPPPTADQLAAKLRVLNLAMGGKEAAR